MKSIFTLILAAVALLATDAFATPTALSISSTTESGLTYSAASADTANGNSIDNTNGDVMIICQNTHASNAETFVFAAQTTSTTIPGMGTISKSNLSVSVPALGIVLVGPLPKKAYNDANNLIQVTYTGTGTPKILPVKGMNLQYAGG
jgi:hypothetical protein